MLELRRLSVALPRGSDRSHAVCDVCIDVARGQTVCVVGESGSGKSVMANAVMRLLPGVLRIDSGEILLEGVDLLKLDAAAMRNVRGARIGMIFQEPMTALNPVMTVGAQIDEAMRVHGVADGAERERRVLALMGDMHLPEPAVMRHRYPFQLSGGQRQRILIAMAMALDPHLLIADEPTTALDVTTQAQILKLIKDLQIRHNIGVLFITHDFGVVADIADQVVVMQNGAVVEQGPVAHVLERAQHAYTQRLIAAVPKLVAGRGDAQPAAAAPYLLDIAKVSKSYRGHRSGFFAKARRTAALDGVSLQIGHAETVGLIGESGSGKTTLGHCVARLLDIDAGSLRFEGRAFHALRGRALRSLRPQIQMVFQDPYASLNPRHRVGRIITENAIVNGVSRAEAERRMYEVLALVGLDASASRRFPHEFSGGQRQRIGIARALVLQPKLIVADEPVSALDVSVQKQVLDLLRNIRARLGLSMLFITHDLRVASEICDRIVVMHKGRVVETGTVDAISHSPQHPYTRALFEAIPGQEWGRERS